MICILNHDSCAFNVFVIPQVDDCDYSSYRSQDITIHRQAFHRAVCTICNYVPGKDNSLVARIYLSLFCLYIIGKGRTLDDHKCEDYLGKRSHDVSNNTQLFMCPECPYMAKSNNNLRQHRYEWRAGLCTDGSTSWYQTEQNLQ